MKIIFHRHFEKQYRKLRENEKKRFKSRMGIFIRDRFDPVLNNHPLLGKYEGYRSINIGGDLRTVYKEIRTDTFLFVTVNTHSRLYGK